MPMLWWILSACVLSKVDNTTMTQISPEIMAIPDIAMACSVGETTAPLMLAMGGEELRRSVAFSMVSASMCSELTVWELELERRQALYLASQGQPAVWAAVAADAAAQEHRAHYDAAQRNLWVWEQIEAEFGAVGEVCPELAEEEQLLYVLGLAMGSLAVLHDGSADHALSVNVGIARQVERGAGCLDNQALWGIPRALQASVWVAVPGAGPQDVDPWTELESSALLGDSQGVWLARALQVQAAAAAGNTQAMEGGIIAHVAAMEAGGSADHGLLNTYAHRIVLHESDRLWVDAEGHRTESGRLGSFPGVEEEVEFDFDAFFGEEEPPPAEPTSEETP